MFSEASVCLSEEGGLPPEGGALPNPLILSSIADHYDSRYTSYWSPTGMHSCFHS